MSAFWKPPRERIYLFRKSARHEPRMPTAIRCWGYEGVTFNRFKKLPAELRVETYRWCLAMLLTRLSESRGSRCEIINKMSKLLRKNAGPVFFQETSSVFDGLVNRHRPGGLVCSRNRCPELNPGRVIG